MKVQNSRIAKIVLENNGKDEGLILPGMETYSKQQWVRSCVFGTQTNRPTKQTRASGSHTWKHFFFIYSKRDVLKNRGEMEVLPDMVLPSVM